MCNWYCSSASRWEASVISEIRRHWKNLTIRHWFMCPIRVSDAAAEVEPPRQEMVDTAPVNCPKRTELHMNHVYRCIWYSPDVVTYAAVASSRCLWMLALSQPQELTTIDCYPMINEPLTDNNLWRSSSQGATEEVGQAYTITFDLDVIMKAMPIILEKPHWLCRDSCGGQPSHQWLFAVGVEWENLCENPCGAWKQSVRD